MNLIKLFCRHRLKKLTVQQVYNFWTSRSLILRMAYKTVKTILAMTLTVTDKKISAAIEASPAAKKKQIAT